MMTNRYTLYIQTETDTCTIVHAHVDRTTERQRVRVLARGVETLSQLPDINFDIFSLLLSCSLYVIYTVQF